MKNKQYLVLLIGFLMLVMSFFLFKKNDSITTKKLKELNYDVTYREAFPDENLRRGIILCIMRNKCGEDDYNSGAYNYDKYYETIRKWPSTGEYFDKYYQALAYQTRPEYGEIIYDIEIEETKKINKADLEKIKVLISRDFTEDVTTLQGIEYLTNLKAVVLYNVKQENLDFSYNKFLEVLLVNVDDNHSTVQKTTKSLNLSQNTMLRELSVTLASEDSNLDYSNLNNLNTIVITESKIRSIILPNYVKKVDLAGNRITNIDLSHHSNLEYLRLQQNPISQIDIEHLNNLKLLNLHNTLITQNLDLSKNVRLEELYLGLDGGKIENLDLSNNPNLTNLYVLSQLKKINLNNNHNLKELRLTYNNLETLDLSKNLVLDKLELDGNHISNLKIPNHITGGSVQTVKFKIKKNSYQELPLLLNDNKVYLNNSINFTRNGDKYVFNKLGTYNEQSINQIHGYTYHVNVQVEVEAGEEASFNPEIDQKDYMPILNEEITKEAIKKMITNLPDNIKEFEIVDPKPTIFNSNAKQKIRVRVTFSDDTFKEFDVPVNIYKVNYIPPTGRIIPNPVEVIEEKAVNISITRTYEKENYIDEVNLIKYVQDEIINYHHDNVPSGVVFNGNGYNGVINYIFTGTEEEHTFVISHSEDTKSGGPGWSDRIQIKLLRDTDGDGIPDIKDDDKDGDGYSNALEIAKGSDPYNKNSTPDMTKKKQLDELVKDLEKLINNTKDNPFNNKNKLDVDNLKNNILPDKENKKNDMKNSYNDSTSDTDLENLKQKVEKEIDDLKKEINKLRDKANFNELDKEISKDIEEDIYTPESVKPLKDKIEEAKNISRDTATQEDVDNMTKIIKNLKDKLVIDRTKLKNKIDELEKAIEENKCITEECKKTLEAAKELYTKTNITKEEMLDMIKRIDLLLNKKIIFENPKTGILSYTLVIIFIILISVFLIKQKKNYIR
jgi:putative surface antigen